MVGMAGSAVTPPAAMSRTVGEPVTAPLATHRIARLGAFGAAALGRWVRFRWRQLLFLHDVGRLRRLRLKRDGPADDWNGAHRMQSMVGDERFIRLRSGARWRALSCGRLRDESGDRDSAANGRDNDGK